MPTKRPLEDLQHAPHSLSSSAGSFRPLLPKKGWEPLKTPLPLRGPRDTPQQDLQRSQRCPVPVCRLINCKLRTHVQYRRKSTSPPPNARSTSRLSDGRRDQVAKVNRISPLGTYVLSIESLTTVSRNVLHGLEALPDSIGDTPVFRGLFHEFFNGVYDRISILVSPPPLDPSRKQACLDLAMTSPAYCLNAIATAKIHEVITNRKGTQRDPITTVLYGKVMSILRTQVANFETAEIDNLLRIICTLVVFEVVHQDFSNFSVHRQGMVQLVDRVGGVHNLDHSLPMVLHLDHIIATYTGDLPAYAQQIDGIIQRPSKHPELYATFFRANGKAGIDQEVCNFCCDVSRALELFEGARISFDPAIANTNISADVTYFYFSRQRIADRFTFLNHKYWGAPGRSKCVLLAAKILNYTILLDNYINAIPAFLVLNIKKTLDNLRADSPDTWKGHEDVLIWILFVLVITPQPPSEIDWAVERLGQMLMTKYNNFSEPLHWKEAELQSMKRFVWCTSRLDQVFLKTCNELGSSSASVRKTAKEDGSHEIINRKRAR